MGISLKELKNNRLTPTEKWVLGRIDGAKPTPCQNGNIEWCDKYGYRLFTQNFQDGYLFVSYSNIRLVLEEEFGLNRGEVHHLLTNLLYDYTDNGKLKTRVW